MAEFPVTVTPEALTNLRRMRDRKGSPTSVVRIGVKGGGCSGLEYVMRLDEGARDTDLQFETEGLVVVCDPKSAKFLEGSSLVWTGNLIGGGFHFENPNAERSCGCGTSFTPRKA